MEKGGSVIVSSENRNITQSCEENQNRIEIDVTTLLLLFNIDYPEYLESVKGK